MHSHAALATFECYTLEMNPSSNQSQAAGMPLAHAKSGNSSYVLFPLALL